MRKREKIVSSIADLLKHLENDVADYEGKLWFRGQGVREWKLQPGFLRKKKNITEFTLITKFRQNASLLIERAPSNYFDWLFQMQHYGVPTRLLDWTESALTALFFSVTDSGNAQKDGALWILLPTELNKNANIYSDENFYIPSFDDIVLNNYNPEVFNQENNTKLLPVAAIASRTNSRMQAQLGVFTISHRDQTPIEEIGDRKHIWRYKIPHNKKLAIKSELALLGITKFQVFPELASIGEIIRNEF